MSAGRLPNHDTDSSDDEVLIDGAGLSDNWTGIKCKCKSRPLAGRKAKMQLCTPKWVKDGNVDWNSNMAESLLDVRKGPEKKDAAVSRWMSYGTYILL